MMVGGWCALMAWSTHCHARPPLTRVWCVVVGVCSTMTAWVAVAVLCTMVWCVVVGAWCTWAVVGVLCGLMWVWMVGIVHACRGGLA